jgi:hypothetical protein
LRHDLVAKPVPPPLSKSGASFFQIMRQPQRASRT